MQMASAHPRACHEVKQLLLCLVKLLLYYLKAKLHSVCRYQTTYTFAVAKVLYGFDRAGVLAQVCYDILTLRNNLGQKILPCLLFYMLHHQLEA